MSYFKRPEEVLDYLTTLIEDNADALGVAYVGYVTQNLIPHYPAVDVTSAETRREVHATQMFKVSFGMNLWIYHADLSVGHGTRTRKDLELVTGVTNLLHDNYEADGKLIFSFVESEDPGINVRGKLSIVTTRISWIGEARIPFNES